MEWNFKTAHALQGVAPASNLDAPVLNRNAGAGPLFHHEIFNTPLHGLLGLGAVFGEALGEIALAVEQGDRHHGQSQIGGGANRIAPKNAKPAAGSRQEVSPANFP